MRFDSTFLIWVGASLEPFVDAVELLHFLGGPFHLKNPLMSAGSRW